CPSPTANATAEDFRYDLLRLTKQKLSRSDERPVPGYEPATVGQVASTPMKNMSEATLDTWEGHVLAAAKLQARSPHESTLGPPGTFTPRTVVDASGQKKTEYFGRTSFIKNFSTPGRHVKLVDPREALAYAKNVGLYK
ncbi:MAG TPA: hypothetical protein VGH32_05150, partial [Pirellulales bacterium]